MSTKFIRAFETLQHTVTDQREFSVSLYEESSPCR
jgi:hypothetical protein